MKKFIAALAASFTLLMLVPAGQVALAAFVDPFQDVCTTTPEATVCTEKNKEQTTKSNSIYGPNGILTKIVRIVSILVGIAAVIMIIVGGLKYALSGGYRGNSSGAGNKVVAAQNTIIYAVVGLVVALLAQAIVIFVLSKV